jgi:hypothetical protein
MTATEYLADTKAEVVTSDLIASFEVVEEWAQPDRGYIRIRMRLANGDFLEAAEYFVVSNEVCVTERYRYQWMNGARNQMRRRWDNVEHYPSLPYFPHHVHFADGRVESGESLSILDLLDRLAGEIS